MALGIIPPIGAPLLDATSERLVDLLFDEGGSGRCLAAPDGIIIHANAEWLRAMGLTPDETIGRDVLELFPEARQAALAVGSR